MAYLRYLFFVLIASILIGIIFKYVLIIIKKLSKSEKGFFKKFEKKVLDNEIEELLENDENF